MTKSGSPLNLLVLVQFRLHSFIVSNISQISDKKQNLATIGYAGFADLKKIEKSVIHKEKVKHKLMILLNATKFDYRMTISVLSQMSANFNVYPDIYYPQNSYSFKRN